MQSKLIFSADRSTRGCCVASDGSGCLLLTDVRGNINRLTLSDPVPAVTEEAFRVTYFQWPYAIIPDPRNHSDQAYWVSDQRSVSHVSVKKLPKVIAGSDQTVGDRDGSALDALFKCILALTYCRGSKSMYICDYTNAKLKMLDFKTRQVTTVVSGLQPCSSLLYPPEDESQLLFTAGQHIRLLDIASGDVIIFKLSDFPTDEVGFDPYTLAYTPSKKSILVNCWGGSVYVFDRTTREVERLVKPTESDPTKQNFDSDVTIELNTKQCSALGVVVMPFDPAKPNPLAGETCVVFSASVSFYCLTIHPDL